jgi:hypothetical protein
MNNLTLEKPVLYRDIKKYCWDRAYLEMMQKKLHEINVSTYKNYEESKKWNYKIVNENNKIFKLITNTSFQDDKEEILLKLKFPFD